MQTVNGYYKLTLISLRCICDAGSSARGCIFCIYKCLENSTGLRKYPSNRCVMNNFIQDYALACVTAVTRAQNRPRGQEGEQTQAQAWEWSCVPEFWWIITEMHKPQCQVV